MSSELEEAKAGGGWVGLKVNSSPGTWERPLGRTVVGSPGLSGFVSHSYLPPEQCFAPSHPCLLHLSGRTC